MSETAAAAIKRQQWNPCRLLLATLEVNVCVFATGGFRLLFLLSGNISEKYLYTEIPP